MRGKAQGSVLSRLSPSEETTKFNRNRLAEVTSDNMESDDGYGIQISDVQSHAANGVSSKEEEKKDNEENSIEMTVADEEIKTLTTEEKKEPSKPPKKRKFGLEFTIVHMDEGASTSTDMKKAPHECVLCLPRHTFVAGLLAKHIHSAQHLLNVLELQDKSVYEQYRNKYEASFLHNILCENIPEPTESVKLLVVTTDKLSESREKLLEAINKKRGRNGKRPNDSRHSTNPESEKRMRVQSDKEFIVTSPGKQVLMVGDMRAKTLYEKSPTLQNVANIHAYPHAVLEKLFTTVYMHLNRSYKMILVVGMHHDFINEANSKIKMMMRNPNQAEVMSSIKRFTLRIKVLDPELRVFFTIPAYVDFLQFNKALRKLSSQDFDRLGDFNSQIMESYQKIKSEMISVCKNCFVYDFNRTLSSGIGLHHNNPSRALYRGSLVDGLKMSEQAWEKISGHLSTHAEQTLANIKCDMDHCSTNIECWADCNKILIIGDSHIFKFEGSADSGITSKVQVIPVHFEQLPKLLRDADAALTQEVEVMIVIGLFREFAQNILDGPNTILEPVMPNKNEVFDLIMKYRNKWAKQYPRLTVVFTVPQCVDFYTYNTKTNPAIVPTPVFATQMTNYTHQYSLNIQMFFKEFKPTLMMDSKRYWLYHLTNSMFEHHQDLLHTLGDFNIKPEFPPDSTFDGFKPTPYTSIRMRNDIIHFISSHLYKFPVKKNKFNKKK